MLERLLILVLLGGVALLLGWLWQQRRRRRLAALQDAPIPPALAALHLPPVPTILYFATAHCAQCRLRQTPILRRLQATWGDSVHVRELDAVAVEELVRLYGVFTTPTTVVLDARHRPYAINHGLAAAERLQQQISALTEGAAHLSAPPPSLVSC